MQERTHADQSREFEDENSSPYTTILSLVYKEGLCKAAIKLVAVCMLDHLLGLQPVLVREATSGTTAHHLTKHNDFLQYLAPYLGPRNGAE